MINDSNDPQGQQGQGEGDPQITYQLTIVSNGARYELDPNGTEVSPDVYEYPSGTLVRVTIMEVPIGKEPANGQKDLEVMVDSDVTVPLEMVDVMNLGDLLEDFGDPSPNKVTLTVLSNGGTCALSPPGNKIDDDEYEFDEGTEVVVECIVPPMGQKLAGYRFAWMGEAFQPVNITEPLPLPGLTFSAAVELVFEQEVPVVPPTTPPEDNEPSLSDRPKLDDFDGEDDDLGGWPPVPTPNTGSEEDQQPSAPSPSPANEPPEQAPARNAYREELPGGQQPLAPAPAPQNQRWPWGKIALVVVIVMLSLALIASILAWGLKGVPQQPGQGALESIQDALGAIQPGEEWTFHGERSQNGKSIRGTFNKTSGSSQGQAQEVDALVFDRGQRHSVAGPDFWRSLDPRMEELETNQAETAAKVEALQTDVAGIREDIGKILEALR